MAMNIILALFCILVGLAIAGPSPNPQWPYQQQYTQQYDFSRRRGDSSSEDDGSGESYRRRPVWPPMVYPPQPAVAAPLIAAPAPGQAYAPAGSAYQQYYQPAPQYLSPYYQPAQVYPQQLAMRPAAPPAYAPAAPPAYAPGAPQPPVVVHVPKTEPKAEPIHISIQPDTGANPNRYEQYPQAAQPKPVQIKIQPPKQPAAHKQPVQVNIQLEQPTGRQNQPADAGAAPMKLTQY